MDSAWLVPAALVFGVVVGAGVFAVLVYSARRGRRAVAVINATVPDGVDRGVVCDDDLPVERPEGRREDRFSVLLVAVVRARARGGSSVDPPG